MVLKSIWPFIVFVFILLLLASCISRCTTEQDNDRACRVTKEYVLAELKLPYAVQKAFTFSEVNYNKRNCRYIIYGSIEAKFADGRIHTQKEFHAVVEAYGNHEGAFKVTFFEFLQQDE